MGFYDKCIKLLCQKCPRLMVFATNSIFKKSYDEKSEVVFLDKEQITEPDEEASYMDMLFSIAGNEYHWEFQLMEDHMAIRMYEYGIKETLRQIQNKTDVAPQYELCVKMPQQAVIFLAGCKEEYIKVTLVLPDEQEVTYQLPCVDASNPVETLIERKLYLLLPFQQVQMNDRMNHIKEAQETTKKRMAGELYAYYNNAKNALEKLMEDDILKKEEVEELFKTLTDIESYVSEKDKKNYEEVKSMGEEDYVSFSERLEIREKEGLRKGRLEGLREGKLEGTISLICKKLKKGNTEEEIAGMLEEELDVVQAICEIARPYAPDYDVEAICKAYMEKE